MPRPELKIPRRYEDLLTKLIWGRENIVEVSEELTRGLGKFAAKTDFMKLLKENRSGKHYLVLLGDPRDFDLDFFGNYVYLRRKKNHKAF